MFSTLKLPSSLVRLAPGRISRVRSTSSVPREWATYNVTSEPEFSSLPAAGSVETAVPSSMSSVVYHSLVTS